MIRKTFFGMPRFLPRQKGMVKAMKLKSVFLAAAACACMIIAPAAHAEEDVITVLVDNEQVTFDQNPVIMNDRTLVPIRAVFEQAGATVGWDQENLTATITKTKTYAINRVLFWKIYCLELNLTLCLFLVQ